MPDLRSLTRRASSNVDAIAPAAARAIAAGACLAGFEIVVVLTLRGTLFLTWLEVLRYVATSFTVLTTLALLAWALGSAVTRATGAVGPIGAHVRPSPRDVGTVAAIAVAIAAATMAWRLTVGRRVADAPWRAPAVAAFALAAGLATGALVRRMTSRIRAEGSAPQAAVVGLAALAAFAVVTDAVAWQRLYAPAHVALAVLALTSAVLASVAAPPILLPHPRLLRSFGVLALVLPILAGLSLRAVRGAPNAAFAIETGAPITGKTLRAVRRVAGHAPGSSARPAAPDPVDSADRGIDLRDRSILLVTVDALRADRLEAYGGGGLTPAMDALARESAVFLRAYTPTPHTSYALASLLTGKLMRPILALPNAPANHATLPAMLRRYGYRTAAFYPPSIFFVDGHRFDALHADGFGFEYRKEMYATASSRVDQLRAYTEHAGGDRPLFVWVHLFEPHEPYDPPSEHQRGESTVARYDGECAAADASVGELVRVFRGARPGATVIVTADHGEEHGEHGGRYHGTTLYDEQVRVPLLWSSPGAVSPARIGAPVEIVDIATTILSALGIPRDARMRGDDLGPVLAGHAGAGPRHAFAEIDELRMITDGHMKAICAPHEEVCQLYDLEADPGEQMNLAEDLTEEERSLRATLGEFIGSIPRVEAMALDGDDVGWPEVLARAALGDPTVAADVVPWLGHASAAVRGEAVRALGRLVHRPAAAAIERLAAEDPDPEVRREAVLALLALGSDGAGARARTALEEARRADDVAFGRRAASALADAGDPLGVPELVDVVADGEADEATRVAAVEALASLGRSARPAVSTLVDALEDVRLRPHAATALGKIGDRSAGWALRRTLVVERYVPSRRAEAEALLALRDAQAVPLIERFLGTDVPLPDGVRLLLDAGVLGSARGRGSDLRAVPSLRIGSWTCDENGCVPGEGAALRLIGGALGPDKRVVALVRAGRGATLALGDSAPATLAAGTQEVPFTISATRGNVLDVRAQGDVRIVAVVFVRRTEEIPPPPPEPWSPDAGVTPRE